MNDAIKYIAIEITIESLPALKDFMKSHSVGLSSELYKVLNNQDIRYMGQYVVYTHLFTVSENLGNRVIYNYDELNKIYAS